MPRTRPGLLRDRAPRDRPGRPRGLRTPGLPPGDRVRTGHPRPRRRARGAPVTFDELRAGLRDRLPWAVAALDRTARALATAITGVGELVHPERAVLGGGFTAGIPDLLPRVTTHLTTHHRPGHPTPPLSPARLSGLSSLRGALLLARRL